MMSDMTHEETMLRQQLAEVTQERDEWKRGWIALSHDSGQIIDRQSKQLAASMPKDEHNRIVVATILSLDDERTAFEARIADLMAMLAAR